MVEMLGVLAIMGIVGMVGVKMYNMAMNKHKANELIYEAQKRATMVAMQITAGQENLSIINFTNPTGYTFGVEKNPNNANQFNITITGVDSKVCEHMKTAVGPATPVRMVSEFCDKLTFNNDLSTTAYPSDSQTETACANAGNAWCGGSGVCEGTEEGCCTGKEMDQCHGCTQGAITESAKEGHSCDYTENGADGVCHNGACIAKSTETNCVNGGPRCNDPDYGTCCPEGYYCTTNGDQPGTCTKFATGCTTNADCTDPATPWCRLNAVRTEDCSIPTQGTCTELGSITYRTLFGLGTIAKNASYGGYMNWWNARNWCEAQGRHLINIKDFQAYKSTTTTQITKGATNAWACAKGKKCGNWSVAPYKAMWNGNTLVETAGDADGLYKDRYSPVLIELRQKYGSGVFWTNSDASSCSATTVRTDSGNISSYYRSHPYGVLCQ